MAKKQSGTVSWATSEAWDVRATEPARAGRRGATEAPDPFLANLTATKRWHVEQTLTATPRARRGEAASTPLTLDVEGGPDDVYIVMTRYASGAIRFHMPSEPARRGLRRSARTLYRFSIPVPAAPLAELGGRRGFISAAIKTVVLKVAGKIADYALAKLALLWETATWKQKGRREGWLSVTADGLAGQQMLPAADLSSLSTTGRNLLFVHGTFSNTTAAFNGLAKTRGSNGKTLFEELQDLYGNRIYGFDHFTLSRTPEENVRMLLEALPDRTTTFDVITHSRGGLVLRHLVERRERFGALADRFAVGRAVLVASPNGGTPLASPDHVTQYTNWLSNVLELFPDNPFTTGVEFVSEALSWIARRLVGSLPGLASMDNNGEIIQALQAAPSPPGQAYSALVANYEPDAGLLQRIIDAGADLFFPTANDLVVPTEGGWRVDPGSGAAAAIPGDRIGCFGVGGNLTQQQPVNHVNFFEDPGTVDFLVRGLRGEAQPVAPIDIDHDLPSGRRRSAAALKTPAAGLPAAHREERPASRPIPPALPVNQPVAALAPYPEPDDVFHIALIAPKEDADEAQLIATFRNARVMERLKTGGTGKKKAAARRSATEDAPTQWSQIQAGQAQIQGYINGDPAYPQLPDETALQQMGSALFSALFPGQVRRLYDAARAEQVSQRLNLIFTSDIGWIADQSWEFIYDPDRRTFLALEEVNFTRNVLTAIPAERIAARPTMRILVVVAQPLGLGALSVEEEADVIRSGFRRLLDAGLAKVELLLDATPELLHRALESAAAPIDVLHFIGHGEYNKQTDCGYLIFENQDGGEQRLDSSTLRQIVCRRSIRLVCLNACETGRGGRQDFSRGVAQALIAGGVPAVVANQYPVLDVSATAFSRHFYWALAMGHTIGDAAREARVSVNYSISGEAIDWAVPVVFARNPAQRLCEPRTAAGYERSRRAAVRQRRRAVEDRTKIGIWNAHRMIPHLPEICERLTKAQDQYAFETVSFPAPIGIWRLDKGKKTDGNEAFVVAETLYERLHDKPKELGVKHLVCMINFPLRDARSRYLYYWRRDPLIVTSTFGLLEQLNEREFTVERMMAHLAAAVVAGIPPHPRRVGPADCPLFYNEDRDIESIAGRLTFCAKCRKQFTDKDAKHRLEAAEQILAAYP